MVQAKKQKQVYCSGTYILANSIIIIFINTINYLLLFSFFNFNFTVNISVFITGFSEDKVNQTQDQDE